MKCAIFFVVILGLISAGKSCEISFDYIKILDKIQVNDIEGKSD